MGHTEGEEKINMEQLGIVLRHPDGTPYTKKEVIIKRRGALAWLPVYCSNDLVHGSWWFVWGSFGCVIFAMIPLIDMNSQKGHHEVADDVLPETTVKANWSLLFISSFFFVIGSWAFVRAFEEPHVRPLFWWYRHFQSDELFAAWLFFFGTLPFVPYTFGLFVAYPTAMYFGSFIGSIMTVIATYLFVRACYPENHSVNAQPMILPKLKRICGPQLWVTRHCANDFLAACWIILWGNFLYT